MNDNFNDIMSEFDEKDKDVEKEIPEYEKTNKQKLDEFKKKISDFTDWFKIPLNLLICAILLIGASLMYMSVFSLTGNSFISILSISISEAGILGWEIARERTKNTEKQTNISSIMRWYHVLTSVSLLVINFIVETATQMLSIKIDGLIYIIFGIVGVTALLDLVNFFVYGDADRDSTNKREFSRKIETLKSDTMSKKLDAFAKSEEIKSQALVRYWEENSGQLAEITGKLQAAQQIKEQFIKSGLTESEIDAVIQKVAKTNTSLPLLAHSVSNQNSTNNNLLQPQKRKYTKRQIPTTREREATQKLNSKLEKENIIPSPVEEQKKENPTNGAIEKDSTW